MYLITLGNCFLLFSSWLELRSPPLTFRMLRGFCSVIPDLPWWWPVQFSSVTQSGPTLCNPMDCSTPGFPVHHQLPELAHTHVQLSWWCHPVISSSGLPFTPCLQSCPASGSCPMSPFLGQDGGLSYSNDPLSELTGTNHLLWSCLCLSFLLIFSFFGYSSWSLLWSWKVLDLSGPPEVALLCWLFLSTLFCLPKVYTLPGIHTGSRLWWGSSFSRRQAVLPVTLTAATMSPRGLPWHTPVPDAFLFLLQSWRLPFGSPTQLLFPAWWVKFSATFPGQRRATCSDFGLSLPFLGHQLHSFFIYSGDSSVKFSRGRHVVTYSEIHHYYFTVIKTLWM